MNNFKYKKAGLDDIDVLVEFRLRFATELLGAQPQDAVVQLREQLKNYFWETIPNNRSISFIATDGKEVVGIGTLVVREQPGGFSNPSGKWGYIMNMYTVPQYRRKGICKNILNELMKDARKRGVYAFELNATKEGEFVYVQEGFVKHDQPTYRKMIISDSANG